MLSSFYIIIIIFFLEENCLSKANYVKIAPKITPMLKIHQGM